MTLTRQWVSLADTRTAERIATSEERKLGGSVRGLGRPTKERNAMPSTTTKQDAQFADILMGNMKIEFDARNAVEWVADTFLPGDVFDNAALTEWALENGFTKPE